jgi:chromatin structure-remodeling complex subunit RSC9
MGLQSGIPREVDFALHHLVVISDERGDKFRFSDFPLFAEALVEKILEISQLTHGITWVLDYDLPDPRIPMPTNTLNCAIGTFDLLDRLSKLSYVFPSDGLGTREDVEALRLITEASLVLRNMVILPENAKWFEDIEMVRDCATIVLSLPNDGRFMEIKNNMLEVVEQCCLYWEIWESDPLYDTLVKVTFSNDLFRILTALRSLNMFSLDVNREGKKLVNIPLDMIDNLMKLYLLDNDPELLSATLDFLYQYTLVRENVEALRTHVHLPTTMIRTMFNYLLYDSEEDPQVKIDYPAQRIPASQKIHTPPPDVYLQLMQLNEPERTARWLKCCFVEDEECEITQLALWQAYQTVFAQMRAPGMHTFATLQATDFISTVTSTFPSAAAKIVEGRSAKFIIKGIRPLEAFYTLEGFPVYYCEWGKGSDHPCTAPHFIDPKKLIEHVLLMHLEFHFNPEVRQWRLDRSRQHATICAWDDCRKFRQPTDHSVIADHVLEEHLPEEYDMSKPPPIPERPIIWPALSRTFHFLPTPVDEKGEPCGVAYKALLILRNIQRNLPAGSAGAQCGHVSHTSALFLSVRRELLVLADQNPSLRSEVLELVAAIDRS